MTEMQAVIGKVQLKKFNFIIKENKKRHNVLENNLKKLSTIRKAPKGGVSIFDTFIFEPKKNRNQIIKYLSKKGFGTKNLPDAIKWHCSYYWKHALSRKNLKNSLKTMEKLKKQIAIPIFIKKTVSDYELLAKGIRVYLK